MRKAIILSFVGFFLSAAFLFAEQEHSYKPGGGYVPDAATAVKIAEAVLIPIYGEKVINAEKPLIPQLKDNIWEVEGTFHCPEGEKCVGGVAIIEISKDNGAILRVSHGK